MDVRVKELLIKIDRLEKREDPQELDLRISKEIAKHEGLLVAQQDKIK